MVNYSLYSFWSSFSSSGGTSLSLACSEGYCSTVSLNFITIFFFFTFQGFFLKINFIFREVLDWNWNWMEKLQNCNWMEGTEISHRSPGPTHAYIPPSAASLHRVVQLLCWRTCSEWNITARSPWFALGFTAGVVRAVVFGQSTMFTTRVSHSVASLCWKFSALHLFILCPLTTYLLLCPSFCLFLNVM